MIVGLFGAAINKASNITSIKENYLLQLPLKGPLNNASIDKKRKPQLELQLLSLIVKADQKGLFLELF